MTKTEYRQMVHDVIPKHEGSEFPLYASPKMKVIIDRWVQQRNLSSMLRVVAYDSRVQNGGLQ